MNQPETIRGPYSSLARIAVLALSIPLLCYLSFVVIGFFLPRLPEPIGSRAELFNEGARRTLLLTLSASGLGLGIGLVGAIGKGSSVAPLRWLSNVYIWIFRGTPLLTQIVFVYYALPVVCPFLRMNEFWGAVVALSLNVGAYNAEAIRAGLISISKGQREAAHCLGFTRRQSLRLIVIPQAIPIMSPALVNNLVALLKDSAMASVIGLLELTLVGNRISSETFLPVPVLTTVAAIYLLLTSLVSHISRIVISGVDRGDWFLEHSPQ